MKEFAILLPSSGREEALIMAERLRKQVAELTIEHPEKGVVKVTVSIGGALLSMQNSDGEIVLNRADAAMYTAKESGRNQICWLDD